MGPQQNLSHVSVLVSGQPPLWRAENDEPRPGRVVEDDNRKESTLSTFRPQPFSEPAERHVHSSIDGVECACDIVLRIQGWQSGASFVYDDSNKVHTKDQREECRLCGTVEEAVIGFFSIQNKVKL